MQGFSQKTRGFRETVRQALLGMAFGAWQETRESDIAKACRCVTLKELFSAAVQFATHWVKEKIKLDRSSSITEWLCTLRGLPGHKLLGVLRGFGVGSKKKKKRKQIPPPGVLSASGDWLHGRADLDKAWLQFFGDMEGGQIRPVHEFLNAAGSRPASVYSEVEFCVDALPTLTEVETEFLRMLPGKACGLDSLPPEAFKSNPQAMAELFYPVYMKTCLKLLQPLSWTGGVLFELYKGSGAHQLIESHRSIFLASCAGKSLHKILRTKVTAEIGPDLDGLHCSSRKQAPVTLPALAIQLLCRLHKQNKHAFGVFLLDTKCAYYSVIREVAVGGVESDKQIENLFHRFCLSGSDIAALRDIIRQGGAFGKSGLGSHLAAIVRSAYSYTWFVTRHASGDELCHTFAGSRPGANFADLVFAFIYAQILGKLRVLTQTAGIALELSYSGVKELWPRAGRERWQKVACVDASWADDTAAVAGSSDPERMLANITKTASLLMDGCRSFGLQPNAKRGKSALLLAIRGKNSRKCLAAHFHGD